MAGRDRKKRRVKGISSGGSPRVSTRFEDEKMSSTIEKTNVQAHSKAEHNGAEKKNGEKRKAS